MMIRVSSLATILAIFLKAHAALLPEENGCPSSYCECEDTTRWIDNAEKQVKKVTSCSLVTGNKLNFKYGVTIEVECDNSAINKEELDTIQTVLDFNKDDFSIIDIMGCKVPDRWLQNATEMFEKSKLSLITIRLSPSAKKMLTSFESGAFRGVTGTLSVTLSPTFSKFSSKAFAGVKSKVIELTMQDPEIEQVEVPEDLFWGADELERLEMKFPMKVLADNIFRDQKKLTTLVLYGCGLTEIKSELFTNLENLEDLRLDSNKLRHLPEKVFSTLKKLKTINLSSNSISSIAYNAFEGAASTLEELNLSENLLTLPTPDTNPTCSPALSESMPNLRSLILTSNEITELSSHCGSHLFGLFTNIDDGTNATAIMVQVNVNIQYNPLTTVFSWWRGENWNIKRKVLIEMWDVPLVCDCDFYNTAIQSNSYKNSFGMTFTCEQPDKLKGYTVDEIQDELFCDEVKDCPLECSCFVHPAKSLFKLECSVVPEVIPTVPVKFVTLTLNQPPSSLSKISPKVTKLVLADLKLRELPDLRNLKEVETVDARRNNLTVVPEQYLEKFNFLLEGNPIACGCDHQKNIQTLQNIFSKKILDYSKVQCREGPLLSQVKPDTFCAKTVSTPKK